MYVCMNVCMYVCRPQPATYAQLHSKKSPRKPTKPRYIRRQHVKAANADTHHTSAHSDRIDDHLHANVDTSEDNTSLQTQHTHTHIHTRRRLFSDPLPYGTVSIAQRTMEREMETERRERDRYVMYEVCVDIPMCVCHCVQLCL